MRLAQLLPSILMMLFVVDLDKGTHIRLYVKAAPIENRLKFQPNTTNHSDNSSQFFFANIPQSSVHTQANISSNNLTNEALNTTSIVQTVPSASESTASRIALTSFDTYPIGSISAIDSEAEPTNSHLNTSFDLFIKWLANASLESSEVNMTNAELLSNWTFGADNSSAILAFSGGNSSVDNSTSDFTFATATNQSEGESESGFFGTTRLTTAESLPLPTVTPPISNPSVYTATSTPESSPIAFTSTAADTSQQSQVEVEATASNLQRDLDSALLQHQLNTAFGILLGGHSPLTRSGSSTTSDNGLRSGYTPQPETESTTIEDYSYEEAALYRPILDISKQVMALLLARDDGTNNAAPSHSAEAGAEVEAEGELQSQTDKQREKTDPTIVHSDASRSFNHSDTSTGKDNRIRTLGHSSVDVFHRGVTDEDTEASSASAERLTPGRRAGRLHNPSLQNESDARHLTPEQLVAGKRGDSGETSDSDEDYVYSDSSEENDNQQESGTTYRLTTRGPMPS